MSPRCASIALAAALGPLGVLVACGEGGPCPQPAAPFDATYRGTVLEEGDTTTAGRYVDVVVTVSGDTATITWPLADGATRKVRYKLGAAHQDRWPDKTGAGTVGP